MAHERGHERGRARARDDLRERPRKERRRALARGARRERVVPLPRRGVAAAVQDVRARLRGAERVLRAGAHDDALLPAHERAQRHAAVVQQHHALGLAYGT